MGVFDEIKKTQEPVIAQPIVKAKKKLFKGYLMGNISNGGGIVKLDSEYALKFIAEDSKYVTVYLLDYGKELKMETQGWIKTKKVVKKLGNNIKRSTKPVETEDLF